MDVAESNELLALGTTLAAIGGAWWKSGRQRWAKWRSSRAERRERFDAMLADFPTFRDQMTHISDTTSRVTGQIRGIDQRMSAQDKMLDAIAASQWAAMRFDLQARFQCDHTGRNQQVNDAYAKMMRVSERALLEYDWKNTVLEEDRPQYERDAAQAFREHRRFERTVRFKRGDGTRFLGHVRIEPYPEDPQDLTEGRHAMWFGSVIVVEELA